MSVFYDKKERVFYLQAGDTSYIMQICEPGRLEHIYWGKKINEFNIKGNTEINPNPLDTEINPDVLSQEYPSYGIGDFRNPAFEVQFEDGSTICDLRYESHNIFKRKPQLEGLPATYVENEDEAETLEITLVDYLTGLNVIIRYTTYEKLNVITRSVKFINDGDENIKLLKVLSMSVDFDNDNYHMLQLSGAWGREAHMERRTLIPGIQMIDSRRGASSHQHNPFVAILDKNADEVNGEVFGFNLVYSGNFIAQVEVDQFRKARVSMGINPFDFSWLLEAGQSFQTPEVVMVYSSNGIGDMSRTYHKLYRTRLIRGQYRDRQRPILVNNWEATYFNFDAEKIESIAKVGKELGIELFVLDDGWFGKRDSDNCSLGDWVVDRRKLPNGLDNLAKKVNELGLQFGLWFEPEMLSPDSDLYRKHPDWCIHVHGRPRSHGRHQRNQLVLDLSRQDVCDEIIRMVSDILKSVPISYVKWDMNRSMTEIGSACLPVERQRETAHRYILGLYRIMGEITTAFPNVLFESCSSGGGRFDPGMLFYMPQTWTSDDTDAVERLKIQYGTSMVYPAISMGAHVSTSPNHQVGRISDINIRGNVAMSGNFGYELDLTKFTDGEKEVVKEQIERYKAIRHIVQFGDFYRVMSPFEGNETAWMFITEDKREAVVSYFKVLATANMPTTRIKLQGLIPEFMYEIVGHDKIVSGEQLMYFGIDTPRMNGDFTSMVWILKVID